MSQHQPHILFFIEGTHGPASVDEVFWARFIRYYHPSIRLLVDRGFQVTLGSLRERSPLHALVESEGCSTISLGATNRLTYLAAIRQLVRFIRKMDVDVVHAHESISSSLAAIASRIAGRATIYHRHHTTHAENQQKLFSRTAGKLSNLTMAVSLSSARAAAANDGTRLEKIVVVHNGIEDHRRVPASEVSELKASLSIPERSLVVVVVGQLGPEKGHDVLFQAVDILAERSKRAVHLLVVGTGSEEGRLRGIASTLKQSRVYFAGQQGDVALWYASADIVGVPSLREAFGLVAIEAMAAGRPIVASNIDGLAEIINNEIDGLLVPPGDPQGLADAMGGVARSDELAEFLSANARTAYEERFSLETMVEGWIACYEKVLSFRG